MSKKIIDRAKIAEALHAVVAERGEDFVYTAKEGIACRYTEPDGSPSCIVGWVAAATMPEVFESLREWEGEGNAGSVTVVAPGHGFYRDGEDERRTVPMPIDDVTVEALQAAQGLQDDGRPWGLAMEAFDRVMAGEARLNVISDIEARLRADYYAALDAEGME